MSKGTVYLINAKGTSRYKIGYTNRSFEQRLAELSGGQSPYPLAITKTILVEDAHTVELELHRQFASYRKYGEWFEFDSRQLKEVLKSMDKATKKEGYALAFLLIPVAIIMLLNYCQIPQQAQPRIIPASQLRQQR